MSTQKPGQPRTRVLPMLLVAIVSALAVAVVYEVGGRLAKRGSRSEALASVSQQATEPPVAPPDRSPSAPDESCTDLWRRYLAQCPGDVVAALTPAQQPAPSGRPVNPEKDARSVADLIAWLKPRPSELAEMAKNCEVRFVIPAITESNPPIVGDQHAAALSLSNQERAVLQRTLRDMHTELREYASRAVVEVPGHPADVSQLTVEEMLADLETRPENGFEEAKQKLAQERAGLAPPPKPGTYQLPGERLLRLWPTMGDELERRLADALGTERARQLRFSPHAVWTNRFARSGCRTQP